MKFVCVRIRKSSSSTTPANRYRWHEIRKAAHWVAFFFVYLDLPSLSLYLLPTIIDPMLLPREKAMHPNKKLTLLVSIILFGLLSVGCASQNPEQRVSLMAIGEGVCRDHGGLSSIDQVGSQAVYLCRYGMSYQLSTQDASMLLNTQ